MNLVTRLVIRINAPEIPRIDMQPYKQTMRHNWPLLRSELYIKEHKNIRCTKNIEINLVGRFIAKDQFAFFEVKFS